jgi:protease secretion system outer membrane protein
VENTEHRSYKSEVGSIQLRQPIVNLDGVARYRQGVAQTKYSDAQFAARKQELMVRLVGVYASAKYAEDQLALAVAQRDAFAEQRKANDRMFTKGEGTKTDMLETQAKYDLAETQVLEAQDNLTNARNSLAAMVGMEVTVLDSLAEGFSVQAMQPESYEEWKTIALAQNPEITALRYSVESAQQEVNKNRAGHAPRLDAIASVVHNSSDTTSTFNQTSDTRSLGLQLTIPLYAGGSVSALTSQAVSNHEKAQAELEGKINEVLIELRKQYNLSLSSKLRIDALVKSVRSGEVLVIATKKSVTGGIRTNFNVLDAQQQLFEAKRDLALARYSYLLSYLRLRSAAGTANMSDLQNIAGYFVTTR